MLKIIIGNKNYSSWSLRAWLSLAKTGEAFKEQQVFLDTPEFPSQIKELSPSGMVPVLHHNELVIHDSLAIGEYLAEQFPAAKLWPAERKLRALARTASCEMHSGFAGIRSELPMNCRAVNRSVSISAKTRTEIERVLTIWRQCPLGQGQGPWLFTDFSIADAMYVPVALRFHTYGIELPSYASAYVQHVLQDNDVSSWMDAARSETQVIEHEEVGHT